MNKRLEKGLDRWQKHMPSSLLRASLLDTHSAIDSFRRIQHQLDIDDPIQRQVLPQLHANIAAHLPKSMARAIKKIRFASLMRNRLYMHELSQLSDYLEQTSIPTLALKGAALAPTYYQDLGCRPMSDIDLLVPERSMTAALNALAKQGWKPELEYAGQSPYFNSHFDHAFHLSHPDKLVIW
ncbi:MAG: hypothetical protein GKR96_11095 [Gammaproteobacteria bacterium]|nr:hypothetical protein [Gammaproteobacteria bacterium]